MNLPYFPLYVGDFEADTSHLTPEQDGVYNRLLRAMWRSPNCCLPYDEADLRRRLRLNTAQWKRSAVPVIEDFCRVEGGMIYNNRLREEWNKAAEAYSRRAKAGARGGKAKASIATAMLKQCSSNQNQNQNQNHKGREETVPKDGELQGSVGDTRGALAVLPGGRHA